MYLDYNLGLYALNIVNFSNNDNSQVIKRILEGFSFGVEIISVMKR